MKLIPAGLLALVLFSYAPIGNAQGSLGQLSDVEKKSRRETPVVMVARSAGPTVVYIQTNKKPLVQDWWGRVRRQPSRSSGSGVVLHPDGYVITNYHVVKDAKELRISFEKSLDEDIYEADVVSYVESEDLALLKIRNPDGKVFQTLPTGNSSDLMIGEPVIAIGNPYGHTHTVSVGIISGLHRDIQIGDPNSNLSFDFDDLIQTDASINPGNSGGPLLNINGELIGINNAVNQSAENIGFAIPIDKVLDVMWQQLISPERHNAWMGFQVSENDELLVNKVLEGSPAANAGLLVGDKVQGFGNNTELKNLKDYKLNRLALRPGDWTELRVERAGRPLRFSIQAWKKVDGVIYERLGIRVELTSVGRQRLLTVRQVLKGGAAERISLNEGDLLVAMRASVRGLSQNYPISGIPALAAFLEEFPAGTELGLEIQRGGRRYQGTVVLD